ncbi:MAG: FKBP-type peptidyl-prolyl cis-trans isomerase [Crocinitomicaceae bacterium]|nr:FKBP-type peptidyl-prolyl cis-trans isomerase [Crocinitomicaceae bacterium]
MKQSIFHIGCIAVVLTGLPSCNSDTQSEKPVNWSTQQSTKMNKQFSAEEELDINLFLSRKPEWNMTKTGSGLRYFIYEHGEGEVALPEEYVDVEYKITLLDGTECYATAKDEVEEFKVDKAQVESGIQEGIKLMRQGDKAILVVPSHLAHGIVGDMSKIPPLSTLIVDITLVKIYRTKRL